MLLKSAVINKNNSQTAATNMTMKSTVGKYLLKSLHVFLVQYRNVSALSFLLFLKY